ncbi:MAG: signal peptide peptidase SppA [Planctomycetes bacterium]|nr:signal peptide peptidase SppA [Planctomycetota bacterium]
MRTPTMRTPIVLLTTLGCLSLAPGLEAQENAVPAPVAKSSEAVDKPADKKAEKAADKVRVPFLKPQGTYADLPEGGFDPMSLLTGGGAMPKAFFPFLASVEALAKVPETEVVLDLSGGAAFSLPQQRELERALQAVRAAGKRITCYLENVDTGSYRLAAQCDQILMADMGAMDLRSLAMQVPHWKDALDLLGVQVEVTRVGAFKGAVEPYMLPAMSDHLRAHYEAMLRSMNDDVVRAIATGRRLLPDAVRALQAQRLLTAKEALASGLVDRLVPWTSARHALATLRGDEGFEMVDAGPKKKERESLDLFSLMKMFGGKKEQEIDEPVLVVLHLAGQIVDGDKPSPGSMVSGPSVAKIDELAANDEVKGVVVRVNSPGGSATASEAIRNALVRLAAKKPLVFSMGDLAASGGYWITTIGQPILAEVGTITGSIGVFGMRFQTGALMRRIGVHTDVVRLDDGALMDATDRPWTDAARTRMQAFVDDIYVRFLANVAASRKKTPEQVDAIAGGRVWSGQQALDNGLVDGIGGVAEALAMVKKRAGVADDIDVTHLPEPKNFADSLLSSMFDARVLGVDPTALQAVLARFGRCGELLGILHEALAGDGSAKVYALLPPGLRVR